MIVSKLLCKKSVLVTAGLVHPAILGSGGSVQAFSDIR